MNALHERGPNIRMRSSYPSVHSLLSPIYSVRPKTIGIDGLDGCRKSTLAQRLSGHLRIPVIEIDSFLDKKKGSYVEHLNIESIRKAASRSEFLVEGVCLRQVLDLAGIQTEMNIYVRRQRLGKWADQEHLGLDQPEEEYIKKYRYFCSVIEGVDEEDAALGLDEEIFRYHHRYVPHENADLTFIWNDE